MTTEPKKYKFNVITPEGREETFTGIFRDENGVDAYTRAIKWFEHHGQWHISNGKNIVFRECLANGETEEEDLPTHDES